MNPSKTTKTTYLDIKPTNFINSINLYELNVNTKLSRFPDTHTFTIFLNPLKLENLYSIDL